jgi:hypothetical protein
MKPLKILAIIVIALAAGGMVGRAEAQQSAPGSMMGGWMGGPGGMMGGAGAGPWMMGANGAIPMMGWNGQGPAMCNAMAGHIEGRLAYLKTELKITQAQADLWNAYADAARENAQSMLAHCTAMMGQAGATALSLPDRLDLHEQFMASQLDALRKMNKTLKPLYAALDETQKQAANQFFWGPMGMM